MALLTSRDQSVVRQKLEIDKDPVEIGRHPECDVIIDDGSVSRHHARISYQQGSYFIEDLGSRNGTYLNDTAVNGPTRLFEGSHIRICDANFVFHLVDQPYPIPQPTKEDEEALSSSVIMDDDEGYSTVMSRELDVPSHYARTPGKVDAERKLRALLQITRSLSESVRRDEILSKILETVFELFTEADRGFIVMKGPNGELRPLAMKTRTPQHEEKIRISRTIATYVMESKRPLISSDAAQDSRFDMSQSIADFRIRSMMCAPLINSNDESLGVIQLDTLKRSIAFSEEDLELFVSVAMQASLAIQKADLFENAKQNDALLADLKLAHELQLRFLPERNPNLSDYDFFSFYKPMQQVGGDYYDFVPLDDDRVAIIVADVVGHGITAAMMMAKVSAEARFALATCRSPVDAISRMNRNLSGMNVDRFVTLVMGILHIHDHTLTIVNAGHMPPLLRRHAGNSVDQLAREEAGLPLGILEDAEYQQLDIRLEPGDTLVLYTDGINESMNAQGQQLTIEAMIREIEESQTKNPESIGNLLCQAVLRHTGNHPAIDDMCLVCLGRTGP